MFLRHRIPHKAFITLLLSQVIAGLKVDVEALESQSYELQQQRDQLDARRCQLEADNHNLDSAKQNLTGMSG